MSAAAWVAFAIIVGLEIQLLACWLRQSFSQRELETRLDELEGRLHQVEVERAIEEGAAAGTVSRIFDDRRATDTRRTS